MLLQTEVPTSTTDWCISALTRSCSSSLPFSIISAWICERRSRVTGSTVWYSSSMPMVKVGSMGTALPGDSLAASLIPAACLKAGTSIATRSSETR